MSIVRDTDVRSTRRIDVLCTAFALIAAISILVAGFVWSKQNPNGSYWDEAGYFNLAAQDYFALRDDRPLRSRIETLVKGGVGLPPAHRSVLLLTYFTGPKPALLRGVSLVFFLISGLFLFSAGRRLAGATAGALAALTFFVSPAVVANSIRFGTEFPLYLAEAALLYFLLAHWGRRAPGRYDQLGLGLALGLGLWSKPSFLSVAAPILAVALFFSYRKRGFTPEPGWIWRAILIGVAIGAVYWLPLGLRTIRYVHRAATFERHSLGSPSLATLRAYVSIIISTGTGPIGAALMAVVAIASTIVLLRGRRGTEDSRDLAIIVVCLAGVVPFTIIQFRSENHDIRLLSAVMLPLALAFALAAGRFIFARIPALGAVFAAALLAQCAMMLVPLSEDPQQRFREFRQKAVVGNTGDSVTTVFAPTDQWDWDKLRDITEGLHLRDPIISYLGGGDPFNRMQIARPYIQRDVSLYDPTFMWGYEYGPIHWDRIMDVADNHSDIVLVAPGYRGLSSDKQPLDNVHGSEMARRLESDPNFQPPRKLAFGTYEPTTLLVFVNKRAGSLPPPPKVDDSGNPLPAKGRALSGPATPPIQ